ncbi:hypothetical protein F5Y08DRAFT_222928 [Xylaria arbuscula]|nr:hypothetical protein F5Y08DRAFT_222928 [Xylaria arbuscula]
MMNRCDWKTEPIAVVGSSCRLPGSVSSPSKLWDLLEKPRDIVRKISSENRFHAPAFHHPDSGRHGSSNVENAYLLDEDYRAFDHDFFGIHAREAEAMDPQQKLLLEAVYESLESSGLSMNDLRGSRTGVFLGQMTDDYRDVIYRDLDNVPRYGITGVSRAVTANRVSFVFDWHGPSENIDTACSSSLVALHHAVQALRSNEADMAVVAGVNLILNPDMFILESKLQMLSPSGYCHMWDQRADGYARGEGVAVLVVKTLQQALMDNDCIECIIRETGVNQNGTSPGGITVPNAKLQTALIKATYAKCGLNPTNAQQRCQYFEAHGTGTRAGDPAEAKAIRDAFFPIKAYDNRLYDGADQEVLQVGSVKTVVGHQEGAAGIVAVLKASLALQRAQIPPNLHFEQLSSSVRPFYHPHLQVPTSLLPWPKLSSGEPRRASVNSFGMGGTNAHVILESWDTDTYETDVVESRIPGAIRAYGPFTLSAHSERALKLVISRLSSCLKDISDTDISMENLAWTLQSRQTHFRHRVAFSATSVEELIMKLDDYSTTDDTEGVIPVSRRFPVRVMAVFTGQGAQWPRMGALLYRESPVFKSTIQHLDESLSRLPDCPNWTLADELVACDKESRIHEAEIAQPLTTALQIALVDMLRASGVIPCATIGHSSGEIAAAYASDFLSASDAICIAYYRGLHSSRARSPTSGELGRMAAASITYEEAGELCQRPEILGKVTIAASNSPISTTFSGDVTALEGIKDAMTQQDKFFRLLNVDKAYHSHHMTPCAAPYLQSLKKSAIEPRGSTRSGDCVWYSSVYGLSRSSVIETDALRGEYWVENLVKPVLFSQTIERAIRESDTCFDLAIEIGPHPTLKGPFRDSFKAVTGVKIPYIGLLRRDQDDRLAFADAIGSIWSKVQQAPTTPSLIEWDKFGEAMRGPYDHLRRRPKLFRGLPLYPWHHEIPLFFESNLSRSWRMYGKPMHPLLGRPTLYGGSHYNDPATIIWRNILKLTELEWLAGHQFQHHVVFPAAGYTSMAIDASVSLAHAIEPRVTNPVRLIELQDLQFRRAMTIDDDLSDGVETVFMIRVQNLDHTLHVIQAEFSCYSGEATARAKTSRNGGDSALLQSTTLRFSGNAVITLVPPPSQDQSQTASALPPRFVPTLPLSDIPTSRFYSWVSSIGLEYSSEFQLDSIKRRRNISTVVVKRRDNSDSLADHMIHIHPTGLDAAFHGLFTAYCFPGDGGILAPYLPSSIARLRINDIGVTGNCTCQRDCAGAKHVDHGLIVDCHVRNSSNTQVVGDMDLFCAKCEAPKIQLEGLELTRLGKATSRDDRPLFSRVVWKKDLLSSGIDCQRNLPIPGYTCDRSGLSQACDRTALFYLRRLNEEDFQKTCQSASWYFQHLLDWSASQVIPTVQAGCHRRVQAEWILDTQDIIDSLRERYGSFVEMQLVHQVGEHLPEAIRASRVSNAEKATDANSTDGYLLEKLLEENRLSRFYHEAAGMWQANKVVGLAISQLAHRYPQMDILELGGGTGGCTASALSHLNGHFASYTFTDISAAFFHGAQVKFSDRPGAEYMRYVVLDIECDPSQSELGTQVFDLVVASNVLHATRSLSQTIAHCRQLLRPGGFLILAELTNDSLYGSFIFSCLPGWWLGRIGDGRMYGPTVSEGHWNNLLKENGFSGVDHVIRDSEDSTVYLNSVMISQATDQRVNFLRAPLKSEVNSAAFSPQINHLVIVGDKTTASGCGLANEMASILNPFVRHIVMLEDWSALESDAIAKEGDLSIIIKSGCAVICLSETENYSESIEGTWFLSQGRLHALQTIFQHASQILWVTSGCESDDPRANMMVGILRTISSESPHVRFLQIDFEVSSSTLIPNDSQGIVLVAQSFLRMVTLDRTENGDIMWSNETELAVRDGNVVHIPRVKPDEKMMNLYESHTQATEQMAPSISPVKTMVEVDSRLAMHESNPATAVNFEAGTVPFTTSYSSYFSFTCDNATSPQYICLGSVNNNLERLVIAISGHSASSLDLPRNRIIGPYVDLPRLRPAEYLCRLLYVCVYESFVAGIGGLLWLHDAPEEVRATISAVCKSRGVDLYHSTSRPDIPSLSQIGNEPVTFIHPRTTLRALRAIVPPNVKRLVTMATDTNDIINFEDVIVSSGLLARSDIRHMYQNLAKAPVVDLGPNGDTRLPELLAKAIADIATYSFSHNSSLQPHVVDVHETAPQSEDKHVTCVVNWNNTTPCKGLDSVQTQPLRYDSQTVFSHNKTYLLVGLAGDIGLSLVEWMVGAGARHFAIASRNPRIDAAILKHLRNIGVIQLKTWALDVADRLALRRVHAEIIECMPEIAGVVNGAMILRDRPFCDMTVAEFNTVMKPKSQGTYNLDELFFSDRNLEFFIVLSSSASIIGNPGQANYSAASMFMTSLIERRRRRGVAASVIHMGQVFGVGHVTRSILSTNVGELGSVEAQLRRMTFLPLSESDLHIAFAGAVVSGLPGSNQNHSIIMGLGDGAGAPWQSVPRFASWVAYINRALSKATGSKSSSADEQTLKRSKLGHRLPLRQELASALDRSHSDGISCIEYAVAVQLGVILQTSASKIDAKAPLAALGIDSLVAVEIRSWFLKEISVEVPVLRILGGASLAQLCQDVVVVFDKVRRDTQETLTMPERPSSDNSDLVSSNDDFVNTLDPNGSVASQPLQEEGDVYSMFPAALRPIDTPPTTPDSEDLSIAEPTFVRSGDMSSAQARLYFLHQYLEDKSPYTIGYVGRFEGDLNPHKLKEAICHVCTLHESLRSCYFLEESSHRYIQAVLPSPLFHFEHREIRSTIEVWDELERQRRHVFDIENGEIFKITMFSLSPKEHHLIFLHHHIALDGVGWLLFLRHLSQAYEGKEVLSPAQQSIDMAETQKTANLRDEDSRLSFWTTMHQAAHDPLPLFPFAKVKSRQVLKRYDTQTFEMLLDRDLSKRIHHTAIALGITTFHFYLSALAVFLNRCVAADDFSIGIVDANRPNVQDNDTMGYFLNMLPLRFQLSSEQNQGISFGTFARGCRDLLLDVLTHRRAPFEAMLDHLRVSRSGSHHPLFQVALDYRLGYATQEKMFDGVMHWDARRSITARNPNDIFINVTPTSGDTTFIHWTTQKYLYGSSDSRLMMKWYSVILDALAVDPNVPIHKCPIASLDDIQKAIHRGDGNNSPLDREEPQIGPGTLIHGVERMAFKYPERVALEDDHGSVLTYDHMIRRIYEIARILNAAHMYHSRNIKNAAVPSELQAVMGILIHPMNDYVCCLLAVLRLGFTGIGLDLRNPEERLAVILSDCRPGVLICNHETRNMARRLASVVSCEVLDLEDTDAHQDYDYMDAPSTNLSSSEQCAVILYTSGSTGVPKGVLLSHRNLLGHITANTALFGFGPDDVVLGQTSPGFDFCLDQIFHALANGGRLVVAGRETRADPVRLAELILKKGVTVTVGCPSEYMALLHYGLPLLRQCPRWRLAFSGGEKLTYQLRKGFQKLRLERLRLINTYGPTEVTIACSRGPMPYHTTDDLIGQNDHLFTMPGYEILIVDECMNLMPIGFPGEVYIAGDGVALGYLNRPEETQLRFVDAVLNVDVGTLAIVNGPPTNLDSSQPEGEITRHVRLYRSGDYGRLLADGSIQLMGRLESNSQVKIRGMRVELDEIANIIIHESAGALVGAAVSFRSTTSDLLVAFVVFDNEFEREDLRAGIMQHLKTNLPLPSHMRPNMIVPIDKLPTNVNGKLDRAALDRLELDVAKLLSHGRLQPSVKDLTSAELQMREIWEQVLNEDDEQQLTNGLKFTSCTMVPVNTIGADTDFFHIGGNSLLAIKLRSAILGKFGAYLSLPDIFQLRTLAGMASKAESHVTNSLVNGENGVDANGATVYQTSDANTEVDAEVEGLLNMVECMVPKGSLLPQQGTRNPDTINILLTGATSFLGTRVLRSLSSDSRVGEIHCVAVRHRERKGDALKIDVNPKVFQYPGDLTLPLFGLSNELFAELGQKIDAIVHIGAQVSFLEPYAGTLRLANAVSTAILCAMASKRSIPLHFVSSAGVASVLSAAESLAPVSIAQQQPQFAKPLTQSPDGYAISKWVSEALLERMAVERGLPVWIHRPTNIVGDGAPMHDLIGALLTYSRLLGAVPILEVQSQVGKRDELQVSGMFDFIPVEKVTSDLVACVFDSIMLPTSLSPPSKSEQSHVPARYIHHSSRTQDKVLPSELSQYLEALDGQPFTSFRLDRWLEAAKEKGFPDMLYEYLRDILREGGLVSLPDIKYAPRQPDEASE